MAVAASSKATCQTSSPDEALSPSFDFMELCRQVDLYALSNNSGGKLSPNLKLIPELDKMKSFFKGKNLVFFRGMWGEKTFKEYLGDKQVELLNILGLETAANIGTSTAAPIEHVVEDSCQEMRRQLQELQGDIIMIGHSRGGEVLAMMSGACPEVLKNPRIKLVMGFNAVLGYNPMGDPDVLNNPEVWRLGSKHSMSKLPTWMNKIAAMFTPAQAQEFTVPAFDKTKVLCKGKPCGTSAEICKECKAKMFSVGSSIEQTCDPTRKFWYDGGIVIKGACEAGYPCADPSGANDDRVPLASQHDGRLMRKLADVTCAAHSDFFKPDQVKKVSERYRTCQAVFLAKMIYLAHENLNCPVQNSIKPSKSTTIGAKTGT